jgi:hypothetical protein
MLAVRSNMSLANSHFKPLTAAELDRDNAFAICSY